MEALLVLTVLAGLSVVGYAVKVSSAPDYIKVYSQSEYDAMREAGQLPAVPVPVLEG